MPVKLSFSALKQTRWYEYGIRFLLGGLATVLTGILGARFGVSVGGLFLRFPPSSARAPRWSKAMNAAPRRRPASAARAAGKRPPRSTRLAPPGKHRPPGIRRRLSFHRGCERSRRFRCRVDGLGRRFGIGLVAQAQASHRLPQTAPISPFAISKGCSPCEALARFRMR